MVIVLAVKNVPFPLHDGTSIRNFNLLRELSKKHEIRLVTFVRSEREAAGLRILAKFCSQIFPVYEQRTFGRKLRDMVSAVFGELPYTVLAHRSNHFENALQEASKDVQNGVIQIQELYLFENVRTGGRSLPVILDAHNIEARILERLVDVERNPLRRIFYGKQAKAMARYEADVLRRIDAVVSLSAEELEYFRARQRLTGFLPNGVESRENFVSRPPGKPPMVLFVGSLAYPPNRDAVQFFVREIWPQILIRLPEARFRVIGRLPDFGSSGLTGEGVELLGRVEELDPYLQSSHVLAVPLRAGAGTRLKILEAFTVGLPVVSTGIGAEGLGAQNTDHLLVRDDPKDFAEAVLAILETPALAERLANNAFIWSQANLRWENLVANLEPIYESVLLSNAE